MTLQYIEAHQFDRNISHIDMNLIDFYTFSEKVSKQLFTTNY